MAEKVIPPQSSAMQQSLLVPGATKKPQKQQQKGHQQSSEHSQQKGPRVDPKIAVGSNQSSRPAAMGSAGQNNRQQEHPAGAPRVQQTHQRTVPKVSIRLSLFDHLPRKQVIPNPHSIEGDSSLHPATIKLGKNRFFYCATGQALLSPFRIYVLTSQFMTGLLYRNGSVQSDDDRVMTLLLTFLDVIKDYKTPPNKNLSWDLDKHIRTQVATFCSTTVCDTEYKSFLFDSNPRILFQNLHCVLIFS